MQVRPAEPRDDDALAAFFAAYAREYAHVLGDQDVAAEGRRARTYYTGGGLLVAEDDGVLAGCVAFEPWGDGRARMKRMYVPPQQRGRGVGRLLAEAVLDAARAAGFRLMVLDTSKPMEAARALYRGLGFEPFEADYEAPCREVEYLALELAPGGAGAAGAALQG